MARVLMELILFQCLFAYNVSLTINTDNDFAKSFVNHFQHSLNNLQDRSEISMMRAASLFTGLKETGEKSDATNLNAETEVKDVKRTEVYRHLVQNGGIQTDFSKPSIGFILQVFENLLDGQGIDSAVGHKKDHTGHRAMDSDTIRSFTAKRYKENRAIAQVPSLPGHEKITMAEIRLLGNENNQQFKIALRKNNQNLIKIKVTPTKAGIIVIPESFVKILNRFHGNMSIILREKSSRRVSIITDNAPIVVIYSSDQGFMKGVYKSYTENVNNDTHVKRTTRRKRAIRNNNERKKGNKRKRSKWTTKERKPCQLHDVTVDFDLIGWGPWIIHPKKFNARACHGQCPSPLGPEYSPTNHAMLQTLMKLKRPRSAPEPCCVPTKLQPLSMLYFEYDDIVVRHHEGMIAAECGCR